ncbi:MAG: tetratricopeptide repeat protein [Pseudorhodoplanes sp.]|nr:tetratricopeptide repeat protein [Pseudorhodoplanes sp.]
MEPPEAAPSPKRAERIENLDFLFGALKVAPDEDSAKSIEQKIWARWLVTRSDTANLLMVRVKSAVDGKDLDLAVRLLDAIIAIKPDYTEAWNRRATIYYQKKDYTRSLADLRQVLAREPRHFGAIMGVGLIMQDLGEDQRALDMYRRVIEIYPRLPRVPDLIKTLSQKVDGRDI